MKRIFILVLFFWAVSAFAQQTVTLRVEYLSAQNVYLDGGRSAGLNEGDTVFVKRDGQSIATLQVIYLAQHSASCKILNASADIRRGDLVEFILKGEKGTEPASVENKTVVDKAPRRQPAEKPQKKASPTRVSGYASVQMYRFEDNGNNAFDFNQPTFRLKLKARNLWGRGYNLRFRLRSRYQDRARRFSAEIPKTEWRNRVYEFALEYINPDAAVNFRAGRILSNAFSGVGYIDGIMLRHNAAKRWHWGVFAGTQPEWQYAAFQTSLQKYGLYGGYERGEYGGTRVESHLSVAGEYHGSTVSRELLYWQNSFSYQRNLNIYQSIELDYNRLWRKDKTGETISLSGLYFSANYRMNRTLSLSLSYDNRKNYITYEFRSLADSLFDSAFRQGLRARADLRISDDWRLFAHGGWRARQNSANNTYSWSAGARINNLIFSRLMLTARFSGFSNFYSDGFNPLLRLSKSFRGGYAVNLNYGGYYYTLKRNSGQRFNQWISIGGRAELPYRFYASAEFEIDRGDDVEGRRIMAELGYRF